MPVCAAYRASLFTGKYTTSTGMVINELRMNPNHRCLGHVLTEAGYDTAYIGKWHLWANELGNHLDPKNSFTPPGPLPPRLRRLLGRLQLPPRVLRTPTTTPRAPKRS